MDSTKVYSFYEEAAVKAPVAAGQPATRPVTKHAAYQIPIV